MKVLHMLEEGQTCPAVARHFGVSIDTIIRIRKSEERVRMTADITFDMSTKRIISPHHKPHILMEAALVAWIVDRSQKNLVLNEKTIIAKALSLYDTVTEKAINDNHGENENDIKYLQLDNSVSMGSKKRFCASRSWFKEFLERFGMKFIRSHRDSD